MNQQDNKLIAKFMKYEHSGKYITLGGKMLYDTDWNWLMPIMKKITHTQFNSKRIDPMADYGRHLFIVQNALCEVDIKKTYTEIVKWIKWYNKKGE